MSFMDTPLLDQVARQAYFAVPVMPVKFLPTFPQMAVVICYLSSYVRVISNCIFERG